MHRLFPVLGLFRGKDPVRLGISLSLFIVFGSHPINAQNTNLLIQPGSNMIAAGNLVLNNTNLNVNGRLDASVATLYITGDQSTSLNGAGQITIKTIQLNSVAATALTLNNDIQIISGINFSQGIINLNNHEIRLLENAVLQAESETSYITGLSGGATIASSTAVNIPDHLNIGNLGAVISSAANLGDLSVSRSHKPAVNPMNSALQGIERTYLIQPQNNVAINATLRFYYLNNELNGADPSTLTLWKSEDGVSWTNIGADTRNATEKYVEKTGISDFSYWTLSDASTPLPLTLISFKSTCENNYAKIEWQTAIETGIDRFLVERSTDAVTWTDLGTVQSFNNPSGSRYTFEDANPKSTAYYRLKIIEQDGHVNFSPVFKGGCSDIALPFIVYPNPATSQAIAQVSVRKTITGDLELFDMQGRRIYKKPWSLEPGINQLVLPVAGFASGTYLVKLFIEGAVQQTQLIKK